MSIMKRTIGIGAVASAAAWLGLVLAACEGPREAATPPPLVQGPVKAVERGGEPIVRVRIRQAIGSVTLAGPTKLEVYAADQPEAKQLLSTPLTIRRSGGQWIGDFAGMGMPARSALVVEAVGPSPLKIDRNTYPGHMRLVPASTTAENANAPNHFDLINHVRLEEYLPGVLDRELYDNWDPATYLAQAIAARSYAIDRIIVDGPGRYFDVESTQASQAYSGKTLHPLALRATADTVGLVLTHKGRVITAYYSSTCGGAGQSAPDAFGVPGGVPPLVPRQVCTWCGGSPHAEWGTVTHHRAELSKRLAAWGKRHQLSIARLGTIVAIRPSQANTLGRPTQFEVTDDRGQKFVLRSESFRHGCNSTASGPLPESQRLRSSAFTVKVAGDKVRFEGGRGFGHCVGLCQYGAQGMARGGQSPTDILAFYYPGAKLERAY